MFRIADTSGRLTFVLCFLLLLSYHATRDTLISALYDISLCRELPRGSATKFTIENQLPLALNSIHFKSQSNLPLINSHHEHPKTSYGSRDSNESRKEVTVTNKFKNGYIDEVLWREEEEIGECINSTFGDWYYEDKFGLAIQGSILSTFHFFSFFGIFIGYFIAEKSVVPEGVLISVSSIQWGLLAIAIGIIDIDSYVGLTAMRAWQGLVQGTTYPCVYKLLEKTGIRKRVPLVLLFSGSWLGTLLGLVFGNSEDWAMSLYVYGGIAAALSIPFILLKSGKHQSVDQIAWKDVLRRDVMVVCVMHLASCWVLHTILIAPTLVLTLEDRWVSYLIMLGLGCVTFVILESVVQSLVPNSRKPARLLLLITTVVGLALTATALAILSVKGPDITTDSSAAVTLSGLTGIVFGYVVNSLGYRQVIEMASLSRRRKALTVINMAGAAGSFVASLWLPSMTGTGEEQGFVSGCLLPLSLVIAGTICVFIFLLFPKTINDDTITNKSKDPEIFVISKNVPGGGYVNEALSVRSADKSFKSIKSAFSAASFKTAVSRNRTVSFNTVNDDIEADMKSIDDNSTVCRSATDDGEDDMLSIKSTEFGSVIATQDGEGAPKFNDLIDTSGDRTSAWLHLHHHVDVTQPPKAVQTKVEVHPLPALLF